MNTSIFFRVAMGCALISFSSVAFADDLPLANSSGGAGAAKALNPDLSLDGLFTLTQFNHQDPVVFSGGHDPHQNGFNIQQVELSANANIDPYLRGDFNLVLVGDGTIEVEEAYATSLDLPGNFQVKAGQFYTAFGRNNPVHPHAWNWANKPLVLGRFFGGDGLRSPGAQVSWLAPTPWYLEVIASVQNSFGSTEPSFLGPNGQIHALGDEIFLGRLNNFFSLTDEVSLNLGASYLNGANNNGNSTTTATVYPAGTRTQVIGGDIYLKYRNPDALSFWSLQMEALNRYYDMLGSSSASDFGWYAELSYRLGAPWERWIMGVRYDYVGPKAAPVITATQANGPADPDTAQRYRVSPVVTFYPSEFSKLRLQYDYDNFTGLASAQHALTLELEFLAGAHGAHKF